MQDESSDDDECLFEKSDKGKKRSAPGASTSKEDNGNEQPLRGSKLFSVYDIASEEKREKKKRSDTETKTKGNATASTNSKVKKGDQKKRGESSSAKKKGGEDGDNEKSNGKRRK